jgi:hypothetical protein
MPPEGGKPLPASAFQVRWATLTFPSTVGTDTSVPVVIGFTNAGDTLWPDNATANPHLRNGTHAVRVTHAWIRADDALEDGRRGAVRTNLPRSLRPGESIELPVTIRTPSEPGDYRLTIELVQEMVAWFAHHGAERLIVPVHVGPATTPPSSAVRSK